MKEGQLKYGQANEHIIIGYKVAREGWNGKDMYVYRGKIKLPYPPLKDDEGWKEGAFEPSKFFILKTADNKLIPWNPSQSDIQAEDWVIVD